MEAKAAVWRALPFWHPIWIERIPGLAIKPVLRLAGMESP